MPVRRYRKDPRATAEQQSDKELLELFDRGEFLEVDPAAERAAIDHVQSRHQARRDTVAALGKELGILRRAHGLTQGQVALALGTKKSNISRLESGQYGGLTIEYFIAVIEAFRALEDARSAPRKAREATPIRKAPPNKQLHVTKPSRALGSSR